jgi:DNA-binding response OmpR family regulator
MGLLANGRAQLPLYKDQHLAVDFAEQSAFLDGRPLRLRRKEYELLALLVGNAGRVLARETLLLQVWGYNSEIRTRTLDVHIRRVRLKLAPYAEGYIETIFGVGYRFQPSLASQISVEEETRSVAVSV